MGAAGGVGEGGVGPKQLMVYILVEKGQGSLRWNNLMQRPFLVKIFLS